MEKKQMQSKHAQARCRGWAGGQASQGQAQLQETHEAACRLQTREMSEPAHRHIPRCSRTSGSSHPATFTPSSDPSTWERALCTSVPTLTAGGAMSKVPGHRGESRPLNATPPAGCPLLSSTRPSRTPSLQVGTPSRPPAAPRSC